MKGIAALAALFWLTAAWADMPMRTEALSIRTQSGTAGFTVEIAETPAQQETGLMHRRSLAGDAGMLFILPHERVVQMWMKDTPLPLDMLFIDLHGKIIHLAENTTPNSTDVIGTETPVLAVLEIKGGTAAKRGIRAGDYVMHPYFTP